MGSTDRDVVSARQGLRLIGPGNVTVPLMAGLYYSRQDPYAIRMSFDASMDEPVVWTFDRDMLAAGLDAPEGIGDIRTWPSAGSVSAEAEAGAGEKILNIVLGPPSGCARFEVGAAAIEAFLTRAYELVPAGQESACLNLDAELTELLSQA
jgi:Streptomyces sporulation and cell division protein, SsgA